MRYLRKLGAAVLILAFAVSVQYITAQAAGTIAYGAATVAATALNLRTAPSASASVALSVNSGEKLVILEETSSDWYYVNYEGVTGYVASSYLTDVVKAENFKATGNVTGDDVSMRAAPSASGDKLASLNAGTLVSVIGINNGWYKIVYGGQTGYVRSDFMVIVADSSPSSSGASSGDSASPASPSGSDTSGLSEDRQQLITYAKGYVGSSYVYGGATPSGFDCSGFVYYVFHHFGYDVTRTAASQYQSDGSKITQTELKPGDLVFFSTNGGYSITHVGIYIGGRQFVHASCPRTGVTISTLDSSYYKAAYYGAKRVLP